MKNCHAAFPQDTVADNTVLLVPTLVYLKEAAKHQESMLLLNAQHHLPTQIVLKGETVSLPVNISMLTFKFELYSFPLLGQSCVASSEHSFWFKSDNNARMLIAKPNRITASASI